MFYSGCIDEEEDTYKGHDNCDLQYNGGEISCRTHLYIIKMNYDTTVLFLLLLINYVLIFHYWIKSGYKGIAVSILLIFMIDTSVLLLYARSRKSTVDVTHPNGVRRVVGTIIGAVITIVVCLIVGCIVGYKLAQSHDLPKIMGVSLPVIATGILLSCMSLVNDNRT